MPCGVRRAQTELSPLSFFPFRMENPPLRSLVCRREAWYDSHSFGWKGRFTHMADEQKKELKLSQQQPYDSSFKMLLDDQTIAMLSFLLGEDIEEAQELKEELFKAGVVNPSLRVDCAYQVRNRGRERTD